MPPFTITLPGGVQVPVPSWATSAFGVIAVAAIGFGVYRYYFPAVPELVSVQQANHLLRLEVQEYNRHIVDSPTATLDDPMTRLSVRVFEDGCLLVTRKESGGANTRLLIDPTRQDLRHRRGDEHSSRRLWWPVALAASIQGRCLNPHPGEFLWRYGAKVDACWVEVWRTFADGCQHIQHYNVCTSGWATNPDGSPSVKWTRCVH